MSLAAARSYSFLLVIRKCLYPSSSTFQHFFISRSLLTQSIRQLYVPGRRAWNQSLFPFDAYYQRGPWPFKIQELKCLWSWLQPIVVHLADSCARPVSKAQKANASHWCIYLLLGDILTSCFRFNTQANQFYVQTNSTSIQPRHRWSNSDWSCILNQTYPCLNVLAIRS